MATPKTKKVQDPSMTTPPAQIEWHHLNAEGKVLGRLATQTAHLLMGKHRPDYVSYLLAPVRVVITNTNKVVLTGRKEDQKMYRHNTGYPSGVRERSVAEQRRRDSRRIVEEAVFGMLPKNKLRTLRMRNLKLYQEAEHPHLPQIKE
jgi:large subunit ribosomal protein L13